MRNIPYSNLLSFSCQKWPFVHTTRIPPTVSVIKMTEEPWDDDDDDDTDVSIDLVLLHETTHSVCVAMNKLVFTKLWLHLIQPIQHSLQSLLELTWVQQCIFQSFLSTHTWQLANVYCDSLVQYMCWPLTADTSKTGNSHKRLHSLNGQKCCPKHHRSLQSLNNCKILSNSSQLLKTYNAVHIACCNVLSKTFNSLLHSKHKPVYCIYNKEGKYWYASTTCLQIFHTDYSICF